MVERRTGRSQVRSGLVGGKLWLRFPEAVRSPGLLALASRLPLPAPFGNPYVDYLSALHCPPVLCEAKQSNLKFIIIDRDE